MDFLQGNQGLVPVRIKDCAGNVLTDLDVVKVQFLFGEIEKWYDPAGNGDVTFDDEMMAFLVPVTERETFALMDGSVQIQARVKFNNGEVDGSLPRRKSVYASITTKVIG